MSIKSLRVIAPPGRICPKEGGKPAGIITDSRADIVPNTAFYRRLLAEGSLLAAPDEKKPAKPADKKEQ